MIEFFFWFRYFILLFRMKFLELFFVRLFIYVSIIVLGKIREDEFFCFL